VGGAPGGGVPRTEVPYHFLHHARVINHREDTHWILANRAAQWVHMPDGQGPEFRRRRPRAKTKDLDALGASARGRAGLLADDAPARCHGDLTPETPEKRLAEAGATAV
jgi:hypothetical protein